MLPCGVGFQFIKGKLALERSKRYWIDDLVYGLQKSGFIVNAEDERIEFVQHAIRMSHGKPVEANIPLDVSAPE